MSLRAPVDRRQFVRFTCPPMYTGVRVRAARAMAILVEEGHVYDISEGGARLEIDEPMEVGSPVDLEIELPGRGGKVNVSGEVVRIFDQDDDPGPRRMAVRFTEFREPADLARLTATFGSGMLPRAA